jgi:hypothetical protein
VVVKRRDRFVRGALEDDLPLMQEYGAFAQPLDLADVVRDEHDRDTRRRHLLDAVITPTRESWISDGKHLVHQQDIRIDVGRDAEAQARRHSARPSADRAEQPIGKLAELLDGPHARANRGTVETHEGAEQENVLAAVEFGVEPRAQLDHRKQTPGDPRRAARRRRYAGQHFQQRALARAVATDHAVCLAAADCEGEVSQCPGTAVRIGRTSEQAPQKRRERNTVALPYAVELNCDVARRAHSTSAK